MCESNTKPELEEQTERRGQIKMSSSDILRYAVDSGIISLADISAKIERMEREKILQNHESKIWQSTDKKWYTYVIDIRGKRRLIKRTTKESLEDAIVDFHENNYDPYINEVFYLWVDEKLKYGEIKKQSYDRYVVTFNKYIKDSKFKRIKVKDITELKLEDFIKSTIHDRELTAKEWSNLRIVINGIFRYAKKHGYTEISITNFMGDLGLSRKVFKRNKKPDCMQVYTDAEIEKITKYILNEEPSLLSYGVLLATQTGLRIGELAALEWEDVHDNFLTINKSEIRYKDKDGKFVFEVADTKTEAGEREVVLTKSAIKTLHRIRMLNPFGKYVFERKNGERMRAKNFSCKMQRICKNLDIPPRSMHKLRKTYATRLLNANVNEALIINQMGHTDINTTKQFYYFNNQTREQAVNAIRNAIDY